MSEAGDALLAALDSAPDAAAREALLAGRPRELLEELHAAVVYRKIVADIAEKLAAERGAFEAFEAELDAAADDDARLKLIETARGDPRRGEDFLAEWAFQRTASAHDWSRRYVALIRAEGAP